MAYNHSNKLGNNGGRSYSFLNRPVLIDCSFVVDATNGLGVTSLKGSGVQNVFMHTSTTPSRGNNSILNPNPASGYALVQLSNNYNRYCGGFNGLVGPLSGSDVAINGSALTAGVAYVITSVGAGTAGATTIAPVADVAGSLASTWFRIYDSYGNTFIVWFSVSGVGAAPQGVSGTLVQQSIAANDSAATIGAALVVTLNALSAQTLLNPNAPNVAPFSAAGTTTVTVTNVVSQPFPGPAAEGAIATGFTFALTKYKTNAQNWANVGLPAGIAPAVGASFIAIATGDSTGGGSTGIVQLPLVSGISSVEVIGDPNLSMAPVPVGGSVNVGGWVMVRFLASAFSGSALASHNHNFTVIGGQAADSTNSIANYAGPLIGKEEATNATYLGANSATNGGVVGASAGTPAGSIALAAAAPAAGSVVRLSFYVEAGSILIAGE